MRLALILALVATAACSKKPVVIAAPPPAPAPTAAPPPSETAAPERTPIRRGPVPAPRAPAAETAHSQPAQPSESAPLLEAMSTPEERNSYMQRIGDMLSQARANSAQLHARRLTPTQAQEMRRVDSFIQQAERAREANDLATALDFASRAEVLSRDLLRR